MGRGRGRGQQYPKNDTVEDKETNQNLKKIINRLNKENKRLKSELQTLEAAFRKAEHFLRDNTKDISITQLIKGAANGDSLKMLSDDNMCEDCHIPMKLISLPFQQTFICPNCKKRNTTKIEVDSGEEEETEE